MTDIYSWALRHRVSIEAVRELQTMMGVYTPPLAQGDPGYGKSEAWVQSAVRLEASQKGVLLFRNNVGVLEDKTGRPVRYGLANDSKQVNETIKSGDLIGGRPIVIQPYHVGHTVLQLVSVECKEPGWQFTGAGREDAQLRWANLINSRGGYARFATGPGVL